ncbi:KpsF/GutQ family sugar-phosphate isomerase [Candidatus Aerophobetes bacterium]|uniref:KpsF/GutQ family sugar-phosphate isomerase n=1 Tax=Aerophobetes bacterium TaxID=2030807 RepID=A0A2A4X1Q2_UNCAE|nr:MAG: KpsF/GutQ family sugar-phosphate isomerase [Candidatus Aerophobetes bacterium]
MLEEIFSNYSNQLNYFFKNIDLEKVKEIEQELLSCCGNVVFAGVGKSGIIAEKVAKTLVATGTHAFSLNVLDALHGDIGRLKADDVVVLLSKSGQTRELLDLIPFLKKRGVKILGWTSHRGSLLEKQVDKVIILPMQEEICPFKLAPTTSSTIQLILGHIIAISMMKKKDLLLEEYAENHPAGNIGKKINLSVTDVMRVGEDVPRCLIGTSVKEGLFELTSKCAGCVIVEDLDGEMKGIFTDGDLRRALQSGGSDVLETPIEQLMTKTFVSTNEKMSAFEAMKVMNKNKKVNVLPVLKNKSIIGLIRMHDLVEEGILH